MNESEIINAINGIADNLERGIASDPSALPDGLRKAIERIASAAREQGCKQGEQRLKDTMTYEEKQRITDEVNAALRAEYQARYASMEREYCRMKNDVDQMEERAARVSRAAETLRSAISSMQSAMYEADEQLN